MTQTKNEQWIDLVDELESSYDNGDFENEDWIEGKAMEAEGIPQLSD